ncbi:MAG: PQQ-like beta-propeller repeat protein [Kiritimatiellae bacterium]|nr:PQQ-like beta-propeller repeat protein [Kiritimatiellia bacterium]
MILRKCVAALSAVGCVAALLLVASCGPNAVNQEKDAVPRVLYLSVQQLLPLEKNDALPVAYSNSLILTTGSGSVRALDLQLQERWKVKLEEFDFSGGATVFNQNLLLASREGRVFCLNAETGGVLWQKSLDGTFSHPPLCGMIDDNPVVWLLSQSDGVLYALKMADGTLLWSGKETNRSDGAALLWRHKLAYGNCDGAVHLFSAGDGKQTSSILIGGSDQMAGTPLATAEGQLWIGTRAGQLALVDLNAEQLLGTLKISESEAFVTPVQAFDDTIAVGVSEGRVLLCRAEGGQPLIVKESLLAGGVDALLFDGTLLYALAEGTLYALNSELGIEASLNVGDRADGVVELSYGVLAVRADRSLLLIKGEWK